MVMHYKIKLYSLQRRPRARACALVLAVLELELLHSQVGAAKSTPSSVTKNRRRRHPRVAGPYCYSSPLQRIRYREF
jgi:hypothetical protein